MEAPKLNVQSEPVLASLPYYDQLAGALPCRYCIRSLNAVTV